MNTTASQAAKAAGLPSLQWCASLIGETRADILTAWAKTRPGYFRVIVAGCVAIKKEKDTEIPAGLAAVQEYALSRQHMTPHELKLFGGVVALTRPTMLPSEGFATLYDYRIWEYYYRYENGVVSTLSTPSYQAHQKQVAAIKLIERTDPLNRLIPQQG